MAYLAAAAAVVTAAGHVMKGRAQKQAAEAEAKQRRIRAGSIRATGQRQAIESRREARYIMSTARARAASSGAGSADPTVVNILADIEAGGEYNALSDLFTAEESARDEEFSANMRRREGRTAQNVGYANAAGSLLESASSFGMKYG
jgi:hypothetical protein